MSHILIYVQKVQNLGQEYAILHIKKIRATIGIPKLAD